MASDNLKIKAILPQDITSINGFTPEHQLVWSSLHATKHAYSEDRKSWTKGSGTATKQGSELAVVVQKDNPSIPLSLVRIAQLIADMENMWSAIEGQSKKAAQEMESEAAKWLKAFGDLAKQRFSKVDEMIWDGLAHTIDSEGKHVVVAPTGRASEYKIVGCNADEMYAWFYGVTMPGSEASRMSYVEDYIVDSILELTEGLAPGEVTNIACLDGDKFPASAIRSIISKEPVTNNEGVFAGFRLTTRGSKVTALDYIKSAFESFAAREKFRIANILPISNDPCEPCYRYLDTSSAAAGPWPTWKQWMDDRFEIESAKRVFMAWCGSLLDAKNTGKQCVWLHGPGNDGKSKVIEALTLYFRDGACSIGGKSMSNQFGMAKMESKRLICVSDGKNKKLLQSEWAHNLTGGDSVDIERKGKSSYSAKLIGKLLVSANVAPEIRTDEVNQVTRLIYIKLVGLTPEQQLKKGMAVRMDDGAIRFVGNSDFPERLNAEVDSFMAACYEVYREMAPTRSDIPLPSDLFEAIECDASDPDSDAIADLVYDLFRFDPMGEISVRDVVQIVNDNAKSYGVAVNNFTQSDVNTFLINRGAKKVQTRGEDRKRVWRGLSLKEAIGL